MFDSLAFTNKKPIFMQIIATIKKRYAIHIAMMAKKS